MTPAMRDALTELREEIDTILKENADTMGPDYGWSTERVRRLHHGRTSLRVMLAVGEDEA